MKKSVGLTVAAALLVMLSGCSGAAGGTVAQTSAPMTTQTPTPTPTAKQLSTTEAGSRYLALVCPANKAAAAMDTAFQSRDLPTIVAAAITTRDTYRARAIAFEDPMFVWPAEIQADVKTLVDSDYAGVSAMDQVSKAATVDQAFAVTLAPDSSGQAAQRIRARLALSADTSAGC